jgi:chromosome segregation ATPase
MSFFKDLASKLSSTAGVKLNQAVDGMTSAIDKDKIDIAHLKELLDQQAGAVTDLDAEVATQHDRLVQLQSVLKGKVQDMQDTPIASPGDAGALQRAAAAVGQAEAAVKTQSDLIAGLQTQADHAHAGYADSLRVFEQRQNELPKAEATVILTHATTVGTSIEKQNEAFNAAAAAGNDVQSTIDRELHKAEAEAAMHGPSTDQRALAALHAKREADDVLARYGMAPAAAPAAPAADPAAK